MDEYKKQNYKEVNIMINFDEVTGENTQKHNLHWLQILDHPYRILTADGSVSEKKTNALHNLIRHQTRID